MAGTGMRSVLAEPRPPSAPARVWRDWVLVGLIVPAATLEAVLRTDLPWRWLSMVLAIGLAPALLYRRTHPLVVVVVCYGVATLVDLALTASGGEAMELFTLIYLLLLPYSLSRWGSGREVVTGLGVIALVATYQLAVNGTGAGDAIGAIAVLTASAALGIAVRYRASARRRQLDQVRATERVELARELHDTVAHHVSAIAIQAQAGRAVAASEPDKSLAALEIIEAEASRTLAEMRTIVRMLRDEAPGYAPQAGVTDIERLATTNGVGPRVDVRLTGNVSDLPAAVGTALFRMAQESVTNAIRHARNATVVDVDVTADDRGVLLRVQDDGDPIEGRVDPWSGFGLVGMAERAALLGGTCQAGPTPGRGWLVEAVLPREAPR